MGRGPKPAKSKAEAKPPVARKSRKSERSRVHDLEKRLAEALEREKATGEILRVIGISSTDIQPVFATVAETASLSRSIVGRPGPPEIPEALRNLPGDLTILLADSDFVSFAGPFHAPGKRVVGIKNPSWPPLNLPNVARNVIIHEGPRHRARPQQRSRDVDVRASRVLPARRFPLRRAAYLSVDRRRKGAAAPDVSRGLEATIRHWRRSCRCLTYDSWRSPTGTPRPCSRHGASRLRSSTHALRR
jgi:hypothetical protein